MSANYWFVSFILYILSVDVYPLIVPSCLYFNPFVLILLLRIYIYIYVCVCVCEYYSVPLNRSWEEFCQDKKTFNSEHLNFPGKVLNVTDITEQ